MGCEAQLAWKGLFMATFCPRTIVTSFLLCNEGSSVGPYMQDYKSLCAAAAIYATLVNIQTDSTLTTLYE